MANADLQLSALFIGTRNRLALDGVVKMANRKRQHYVPQFYMRQFADADKHFAVYALRLGKIIPSVPCKTQCCCDYFYGDDFEWENRFSLMEAKWAKAIREAARADVVSDELSALLKQFALFQRQRTLAELGHRRQELCEFLEEAVKVELSAKGLSIDPDEVRRHCEKAASRENPLMMTLEIISDQQDLIEDLQTMIIEYETPNRLVSSDAPVIAVNPFHRFTVGLGSMGLILFYPIDGHRLVVVYDGKMYPKNNGSGLLINSDSAEVAALNDYQLVSADQIVFGIDEGDLSRFSEKAWRARRERLDSPTVTALGPPESKMLRFAPRQVLLDHELSFGEVRHSFKRIPFACREAVPRKWEQGWEDKLNMKEDMMLGIKQALPDLLADSELTSKELRRGYRMMARSAAQYWSK